MSCKVSFMRRLCLLRRDGNSVCFDTIWEGLTGVPAKAPVYKWSQLVHMAWTTFHQAEYL